MRTNQFICGDAAHVLKDAPNESVDLVVTDPPYLVKYKDRLGRTLANDDNPDAVLSVFDEIYRILKPSSYCISFYGWNAVAEFAERWKSLGFATVGHIVWVKSYASRQGHTRYRHESAFVLAKGWPQKPQNPIPDVLPWEYTGNKHHPTEKAVSVIEPLIKGFSKPGDVVVDPFSGSGSTSVAAALHGRDYIGIDVEERYCAHARERIARLRQMQSEELPTAA
ncbi:MAG: DNA methyltransferase [Henriciella sp.]|nr:DNA methyltransferase [Henriciella sp.]